MIATETSSMRRSSSFQQCSDLECPTEISWVKWSIGSEHAKKLTVKNISKRTIRFSCRLRKQDGTFELENAMNEVKLSPGLTITFDVVFRPTEFVDYDDMVIVKSQSSECTVRISAVRPVVSILLPDKFDMGYCPVKEISCRSFFIENDGGIQYDFQCQFQSPFEIKPSQGTMMPGQKQEMFIYFQPEEACVLVSQVVVRLSTGQNHLIKLGGIGKFPYLAVSNPDVVFEGKESANTMDYKELVVENRSLVPAQFAISRNEEFSGNSPSLFSFSPTRGVVLPHKSVSIEVCRLPTQNTVFSKETFEMKTPGGNRLSITCSWKHTESHIEHPLHQSNIETIKLEEDPSELRNVNLYGEYDSTQISLSQKMIDFDEVLIGESETQTLILFNHSEKPIPFRMLIIGKDGEFPNDRTLCFEEDRGVLEGRSSKVLTLRYHPLQRRKDHFVSFCVVPTSDSLSNLLFSLDGKDVSLQIYPLISKLVTKHNSGSISLPFCEVRAVGNYPTLGITDIFGFSQRKAEMWKNFSVDSINSELLLPQRKDSLDNLSFKEKLLSLKRVMLDFGASLIESSDSVVYVHFTNLARLPATLKLSFAQDTVANMDRWAQNLVPKNEADERELDIIFNDLYQIQPRRLDLNSGESGIIRFKYRHHLVGSHSIPVLLEVNNGVSIALDLTGQTLDEEQPYIHLSSFEHEFESVDISMMEQAPIQYFMVHNPSRLDVQFSVDFEQLERLKFENYDYPVIELLNPTGCIPSQGSALLQFIFKPLEEKYYEVELPLHIIPERGTLDSIDREGLSYYITFGGRGTSNVTKGRSQDTLPGLEKDTSGIISPVPSEVPPVQSICGIEDQLASLSLQVLDLGQVPCHSLNKRLVIIQNRCTDVIRYDWDTDMPKADHGSCMEVSVEPVSGILGPGESKAVVLAFSTGSLSQVLNNDICCTITNETTKKIKETLKKEMESTLHSIREEDEILGSDSTIRSTLRSSRRVHRPPVTGERKVLTKIIKNSLHNQSGTISEEKLENQKLFIRIHGHIVSLSTYRMTVQDPIKNCYIPKVPYLAARYFSSPSMEPSEISELPESFQDLCSNVIGHMLQDIVHDKDVIQAYETDSQLDETYFFDISSKELLPPPNRSNLKPQTLLEDPEFQALAEWILSETILNIVDEMIEDRNLGEQD